MTAASEPGFHTVTGYHYLTREEILTTVMELNAAGSSWMLYLETMPVKPRRTETVAGVWRITMPMGETFAHTRESGWLHIGTVPQLAGQIPDGH